MKIKYESFLNSSLNKFKENIMNPLSRRNFIKTLSIGASLGVFWNPQECLSYLSPVTNEKNDSRVFVSKPPNKFFQKDYGAKVLYIGIGELGLSIGNAILVETKIKPYPDDDFHLVPIIHFNLNNYFLINKLLSHAHLVFLVGSSNDSNFWIARDLIFNYSNILLVTINPIKNENSKFKAGEKEVHILIPEEVFIFSAIKTILSVSGLLMFKSWIGYDFADFRSSLSGKNCLSVHLKGSFININKKINRKILYDKTLFEGKPILSIVLYNNENCPTLDLLTDIIDKFFHRTPNNEFYTWGVVDCIKISSDIEITTFFEV